MTKGAFDTVLACCDRLAALGDLFRLIPPRARLAARVEALGIDGVRVLGVATGRPEPKARHDLADKTAMIFEGFLLFDDPVKPGVADTLADLRQAGLAVKITTGDNRHVAPHAARAVGMEPAGLSGSELAQTRDEAPWHLAETCNVFAEVDPQQKERIVRALQMRGHSVTYPGDGINDAPALHQADAGISVDQAVNAARESADIVLALATLAIALMAMALPWTGPVAAAFGLVPLPTAAMAAGLAVVLLHVATTEAPKRWSFRATGQARADLRDCRGANCAAIPP